MTRLYGTADAVTTTYAYSAGGERLTSITDSLSHATTFAYDAKGGRSSVAH